MAIVHDPQLLIADEPTTALDTVTQKEIIDLIQHWAEQEQASVLLISHDMRLIGRLCQRVYHMADGNVGESKTPHSRSARETIKPKQSSSDTRTNRIRTCRTSAGH